MTSNKNIDEMTKEEIETRINEIEGQMSDASFWEDGQRSNDAMSELNHLKSQLSKVQDAEVNYDERNAVITFFAGAGGTDSEDFVRILLDMYRQYADTKGWRVNTLHEHVAEHGGYKNVTIEIEGKHVYGTLKYESGVHRLVRISPFDSDKQRHTSFAMVEVIPKFEKPGEIDIPDDEIEVDFSKSSGPGGQNVNKRETAVRMTHVPSGLSVHADSERTQQANREKARQLLEAKLWHKKEEDRRENEERMYVSKTTDAEWGSQIRSYVFHPYQQVKDHRTGVTVQNVDDVLSGEIQSFIDAEVYGNFLEE